MILAFALFQEASVVHLDLKPGKVVSYDVLRDYRDPVMGDRIAYYETMSFIVMKSDDIEKSFVRVETRSVKMIVDTQEFDQTQSQEVTSLKETWSQIGQVLEREPYPHFANLRARQLNPLSLMRPLEPMVQGLAWGHDQGTDPRLETPPSTWKWLVEGVTPKEVVVNLNFKESESSKSITADGTLVLSRKDGWLESCDVNVHNTIVPGDEELAVVNLHWVWKRRP